MASKPSVPMKENQISRDLLVDTGVGIYSLPEYLKFSNLREDQEKPLDVVLTHAHFDHSGGAHQFNKVQKMAANYILAF